MYKCFSSVVSKKKGTGKRQEETEKQTKRRECRTRKTKLEKKLNFE